MLIFENTGKLTKLDPRKEFKGDDRVKAVTIKIETTMKAAIAEAAFVKQLSILFDDDDSPVLSGIEPIKVSNKVENVEVTINGAKLHEMTVDGVKLTPKSGGQVDVSLTVKGQIGKNQFEKLFDVLLEDTTIKLVEKQVTLDEQAPQAA